MHGFISPPLILPLTSPMLSLSLPVRQCLEQEQLTSIKKDGTLFNPPRRCPGCLAGFWKNVSLGCPLSKHLVESLVAQVKFCKDLSWAWWPKNVWAFFSRTELIVKMFQDMNLVMSKSSWATNLWFKNSYIEWKIFSEGTFELGVWFQNNPYWK